MAITTIEQGNLVYYSGSTYKPSSGITIVDNNLFGEGYFIGKKCGVFAYLQESATTSIVSANTYYAISGIFSNSPSFDFIGVSGDPSIQYTGSITQYFEIDWHSSFKTSHNGCTICFGIKKNGTLVASSVMNQYAKTSGEIFTSSGTCVVELEPDDKIQLVLKSDHASESITIENFTTTMCQFFN